MSNTMKTKEAIDVVVECRGNPGDWNYELMEAAEVLASEVASLRKIVSDEAKHREKRWLEEKNQYTQGRLHEVMEIKSRFDIR